MSRDYISDPSEDVAFTLRRIEDLLARLVDAVESIVPVLVDPSGPPVSPSSSEDGIA